MTTALHVKFVCLSLTAADPARMPLLFSLKPTPTGRRNSSSEQWLADPHPLTQSCSRPRQPDDQTGSLPPRRISAHRSYCSRSPEMCPDRLLPARANASWSPCIIPHLQLLRETSLQVPPLTWLLASDSSPRPPRIDRGLA